MITRTWAVCAVAAAVITGALSVAVFRVKSGDIVTLLFSAELLPISGEPCVLSATQDVTAFRKVGARHRAILKAIPNWMFLLTRDGVFLKCQVRDSRQLLRPPDEFLGRNIRDISRRTWLSGSWSLSGPDVSEVRAALGDIVSDNRRIGEVLRRLRLLLRKDRREHVPVDVNAIVTDVVELVHSDLVGRQVALEVTLTPDLPSVLGDRIQLQQVMLNLLMNAGEAIRPAGVGGGQVNLSTAREVSWSRSPTTALAPLTSNWSECSSPSIRPRPTAWAWDSRFPARSWTRMRVRSPRGGTPIEASRAPSVWLRFH